MFPVARSGGLHVSLCWRLRHASPFSSSSFTSARHPNTPLHLDPSLKALLKDVDISLTHSRTHPPPQRKELEVLPVDKEETNGKPLDEEDAQDEYTQRKSPAAHFGSQQIGAVTIPIQLRNSINVMISGVTLFILWHLVTLLWV